MMKAEEARLKVRAGHSHGARVSFTTLTPVSARSLCVCLPLSFVSSGAGGDGGRAAAGSRVPHRGRAQAAARGHLAASVCIEVRDEVTETRNVAASQHAAIRVLC
jgi:hypothetical protein